VKIRPTVIEILTLKNDVQNFTFQKRANSDKNWPIVNVCLRHKSTLGVHYRTGSPGELGLRSLDSRVTGSLAHKMRPISSVSGVCVCVCVCVFKSNLYRWRRENDSAMARYFAADGLILHSHFKRAKIGRT